MISATKFFSFSASHQLPHHEGVCANMHGHNYKLEVTVFGPIKDEGAAQGMLLDFQDLDAIVNETIIKDYDHAHLNDLLENPTAEVMVKHFADLLTTVLTERTDNIRLLKIKLWETEKCYAEFTNP